MTRPAKLTRVVRGKRPKFFATAGEDLSMSMILVLAQELCVLRARLDAVEGATLAKGLLSEAEIAAVAAADATLARQEAQRQDLLERLFYVLRQQAAEAAAGDTAERFQDIIDRIARG
jgi:hypothetical protein